MAIQHAGWQAMPRWQMIAEMERWVHHFIQEVVEGEDPIALAVRAAALRADLSNEFPDARAEALGHVCAAAHVFARLRSSRWPTVARLQVADGGLRNAELWLSECRDSPLAVANWVEAVGGALEIYVDENQWDSVDALICRATGTARRVSVVRSQADVEGWIDHYRRLFQASFVFFGDG